MRSEKPDMIEGLQLTVPEDYYWLNQGVTRVDGMDDKAEFDDTDVSILQTTISDNDVNSLQLAACEINYSIIALKITAKVLTCICKLWFWGLSVSLSK